MKSDKKLILYPCIKVVKGVKRSALYDLQRYKIFPIPNSYLELFSGNCVDINKAYTKFPDDTIIINNFEKFLIDNELAIKIGNLSENFFKELDDDYFSPVLFNHAILDYDCKKSYPLKDAISQLSELRCEGVKIRLYDRFSLKYIINIIKMFNNTSIRGVELRV